MLKPEPIEHIGRGTPPVHSDWRLGVTCDMCDTYQAGVRYLHEKNFEDNWAGISFASVPGGASVARLGGGKGPGKMTPMESQKHFDRDLDSYREAKKHGMRPERSDQKAVYEAEARAESHDRVKRKADKGMYELGGLKFGP